MNLNRWSLEMTMVKPTSRAEMSIMISSVVIRAIPRSLEVRILCLRCSCRLFVSIDKRKIANADRRAHMVANVVGAVGLRRQLVGPDADVHVHLADLAGQVCETSQRDREGLLQCRV